MPKLPPNAQVEFLAPLSSISVRLERHCGPADGQHAVNSAGANAADLAAAEAQQAMEREALKSEQMARFQRDLLKRVSARMREQRKEKNTRLAHAHPDESATVQRARAGSRVTELVEEPESLLEARVGQVIAETAMARHMMTGGAYSAPMVPNESHCTERLDDKPSEEDVRPGPSANRVVAVRGEWAFAERQATRSRRAAEERQAQERMKAAKRRAASRARVEAQRAEEEAVRRIREVEIAHQHQTEELERMFKQEAAKKRAQKLLQTERYTEARRELLRKEAEARKLTLPPLCACGLDPLDNHVDNCAVNCVFFKNPQAYSRALSGLFLRPINLV
eukprot:scaffold5498_cov37-Tisochrysis_lutea.AAC.1